MDAEKPITYPTRAVVVDDDGEVVFNPWIADCVILSPPRLSMDICEIDVRYDDGRTETRKIALTGSALT